MYVLYILLSRPDEDYLLALDSTKWLQRVGELMTVANSVVKTLTELKCHVLVCFESGWDRTTQVDRFTVLVIFVHVNAFLFTFRSTLCNYLLYNNNIYIIYIYIYMYVCIYVGY